MSVAKLVDKAEPGQTAAEIATAANAATVEKRDEGRYTGVALADRLGFAFVETIVGKLEAANQTLAVQFLNGVGINFAHAETQGMLNQLEAGGVFTADEANTLRQIGIWHVTPWSEADGDDNTPVTEQQVQAELDKRSLMSIFQARVDAADEGVANGSITTVAELNMVLGGGT